MTIAALIAGFLMFLAPCTLPLLPVYIAFISGTHVRQGERLSATSKTRLRRNALLYIAGFSFVFIFFGLLAGLGGRALIAYRPVLMQIGGAIIFLFGLMLLGVFNKISFLQQTKKLSLINHLTPGKGLSAFILGVTLALGWTPCIGPILGSILLLASTSETIWQGAWLLSVFSLGLGIPFFLSAIAYDALAKPLYKIKQYATRIEQVGGVLLIIIGGLMITGRFGIWEAFFYDLFSGISIDSLLNYL